jgi:hypothetical protein
LKVELTATALFAVAILLINAGAGLVQAGSYYEGGFLILIGLAVILVTVYLLEKGIIEKTLRLKHG